MTLTKSQSASVLILCLWLLAGAGMSIPIQAQDVFVVPRHPGNLPETKLEHPSIPKRPKAQTLPRVEQRVKPKSTPDTTPKNVSLRQPSLLENLSWDKESTESQQKRAEERRQLSSEGYFFVKGQIEGVGWAKLYLYDHRGGFFDIYDRDKEMNLLGTANMDANGEFRIGPIKYKNQWYYRGKDIILIMELDSPYAVAYSDIYGTVQPFRYKIAERKRVTPEGGEYSLGTINLDLEKEKYYPLRAFDRLVRRLQAQGTATEQKVRIEFVRDVEDPRYMEEIGYILMPYSGQATGNNEE